MKKIYENSYLLTEYFNFYFLASLNNNADAI